MLVAAKRAFIDALFLGLEEGNKIVVSKIH